jgi:hypothetical protein
MYTKTVSFTGEIDQGMLAAHLAECLRQINARTVRIDREFVSFTGGIFGDGSKWDVLIPFGFGDLTIDSNSHQLRYRLSFRQLFAVTAVLAAIIVALTSYWSRWSDGLIVGIIGWVWLVGLSLFIGLPRFKKFVHGAIDTAPRTTRRRDFSTPD